jgi:hypothetical protein
MHDPVANAKLFRVEWRGRICPLGNTDAFRLARLLLERRDRYVSYDEIAEIVLQDPDATSNAIRNLKYRLCRRLRTCGMHDLADMIKSDKEHYTLAPLFSDGVTLSPPDG